MTTPEKPTPSPTPTPRTTTQRLKDALIGRNQDYGDVANLVDQLERELAAATKECELHKANSDWHRDNCEATDELYVAAYTELAAAHAEIARLQAIITGPFAETAALHETLRQAGCVSVNAKQYDTLRAEIAAANATAAQRAESFLRTFNKWDDTK